MAEITADNQTCAKRNVHGRTLKDIMKVGMDIRISQIHLLTLALSFEAKECDIYTLLMTYSIRRCPVIGSHRHVIWFAWMSGPSFRMLLLRR